MSVQEALALHCVILGYPASACLCLCVCTPGIRQLQLMLLKVSLILGVEIHVNVEFTRLVEPPAEQTDGSECVCVCAVICVLWVAVAHLHIPAIHGKLSARKMHMLKTLVVVAAFIDRVCWWLHFSSTLGTLGLAPGNMTQPFISFEDWATYCSCCVAIKNLPH